MNGENVQTVLILVGSGVLVAIRLSPLFIYRQNTDKYSSVFYNIALLSVCFGVLISSISVVDLDKTAIIRHMTLVMIGFIVFMRTRSLSLGLISGMLSYALLELI